MTFEPDKADGPAFNPGDGRSGSDREDCADIKGSEPLENQREVSVPHAEADGKYQREKRQEKRGDDNGDWIVFYDARREQDSARHSWP